MMKVFIRRLQEYGSLKFPQNTEAYHISASVPTNKMFLFILDFWTSGSCEYAVGRKFFDPPEIQNTLKTGPRSYC